jgi:two-component system, LuxR family, sensor kinase FixL
MLANPLKDLSFQTLFDAAADAMLLVNDTGHVVEANSAALELLEYTEEALLGLEVEALMPTNFRDSHRQYRNTFYKNPEKRSMGSGRDLFALSRSGKEIAVDIGLSPIQAQEQAYILITFYPAEKRRKAEQELRVSEERLRLAKQAANLGTFDYDPANKGHHWDARTYELWSRPLDEPMTYEKFTAAIHPDDRAARQAALERATDPAGDGEYKAEYRVINPKDGVECWISAIGQMHFKDGRATRLIGIVQDVTEHKMLEQVLQEHREETEDVFQQQVAIRTASAIAHELNQPLAAISAYGEVALHALNHPITSSPEKLKHALEGCVTQAQRAGTSLHELLAFLQEGELVTERFDLNAIVLEAISITKSDDSKEFQLKLHLDKHMPTVLANRIHVQKVLVNLLRNAVEAMRGAKVAASEIAVMVRTHKEMNMAHVTVKDSGPGISQEMVKKIFEPFFTTKSTGIGMGLAISRALIEANNGQMWLEPSTKPGAIFHFTLPFAP